MSIQAVKSTSKAKKTLEGAGVQLYRAFGFNEPEKFDPFLLFDDFRNDHQEDFIKGFPWHPHRGIETITYVLTGSVEHMDSLGNKGALGAGSVQWMTAGSGIMHQEMPKANEKGQMHGFQLWANLPSNLKMTPPRYQDIQGGDIPEVIDDDGVQARIITGEFWGRKGPVDGIAADPLYLDIFIPANQTKILKLDTYRNSFAYIFQGNVRFDAASSPKGVLLEKEVEGEEVHIRDYSGNRTLVEFSSGNEITAHAGNEGARFLFISGAPLQEPIAWHGPIVMNSREELFQAFKDLRNDNFIRNNPS